MGSSASREEDDGAVYAATLNYNRDQGEGKTHNVTIARFVIDEEVASFDEQLPSVGEKSFDRMEVYKRNDDNDTDFTDSEWAPPTAGQHDDRTSVIRSKPKHIHWIIVLLIAVFVVLAITVGIRCSMTHACHVHEVPSVALLLNSTETSLLTVTGLNTLIAMHAVLTGSTSYMIKDNSCMAAAGMIMSAIALYVMIYFALIFTQWYIGLVPIVCMILWCITVVHGLHRFYMTHPTRKLFFLSLFLCIVFSVSSVLYIAFSAVPYELVPGKDIAIFVCELSLVVTCLLFALVLIFHIRRLSYILQVKKSYHTVAHNIL